MDASSSVPIPPQQQERDERLARPSALNLVHVALLALQGVFWLTALGGIAQLTQNCRIGAQITGADDPLVLGLGTPLHGNSLRACTAQYSWYFWVLFFHLICMAAALLARHVLPATSAWRRAASKVALRFYLVSTPQWCLFAYDANFHAALSASGGTWRGGYSAALAGAVVLATSCFVFLCTHGLDDEVSALGQAAATATANRPESGAQHPYGGVAAGYPRLPPSTGGGWGSAAGPGTDTLPQGMPSGDGTDSKYQQYDQEVGEAQQQQAAGEAAAAAISAAAVGTGGSPRLGGAAKLQDSLRRSFVALGAGLGGGQGRRARGPSTPSSAGGALQSGGGAAAAATAAPETVDLELQAGHEQGDGRPGPPEPELDDGGRRGRGQQQQAAAAGVAAPGPPAVRTIDRLNIQRFLGTQAAPLPTASPAAPPPPFPLPRQQPQQPQQPQRFATNPIADVPRSPSSNSPTPRDDYENGLAAVAAPPPPLREAHVSNALTFLNHPRVKDAFSLQAKRAFLEDPARGLTRAEIGEAMRRAGLVA